MKVKEIHHLLRNKEWIRSLWCWAAFESFCRNTTGKVCEPTRRHWHVQSTRDGGTFAPKLTMICKKIGTLSYLNQMISPLASFSWLARPYPRLGSAFACPLPSRRGHSYKPVLFHNSNSQMSNILYIFIFTVNIFIQYFFVKMSIYIYYVYDILYVKISYISPYSKKNSGIFQKYDIHFSIYIKKIHI